MQNEIFGIFLEFTDLSHIMIDVGSASGTFDQEVSITIALSIQPSIR